MKKSAVIASLFLALLAPAISVSAQSELATGLLSAVPNLKSIFVANDDMALGVTPI